MSNETNTPWHTSKWANTAYMNIIGADGELVINALPLPLAAHIVKCVNSHEGLVEALQNILTWDDGNLPGDILDEARAVLAKVQGEGK